MQHTPYPLEMLPPLDVEAHEAIQRVVHAGELVVDATAGNGHDTQFLARLVGVSGAVVAFDVQQDALDMTRTRLAEDGCLAQTQLILAGHEQAAGKLDELVQGTTGVAAVMFNLGFLPGSDKTRMTQVATTRAACESLLPLLRPGGVMTIHAYTGHEGGREEADAVLDWAGGLDWTGWQVRMGSQLNKPKNIEYLLIIQRRTRTDTGVAPRQPVPVRDRRRSGRVLADTPGLAPQRVLAVDDAPENLRLVVETLRGEYVMMVATNGPAALRLAASSPQPDVILLDVVMPQMNGYEVCRLLKEDPLTREIPILFLTGASDSIDEARGLAVGAVDYIHKPFQPDILKTRVRIQAELMRHRTQLEQLVFVRTRELTLTREVTIDTLANLAECRSLETGSHIRRTKRYVRLLAEALLAMADDVPGLTLELMEQLEISAPLHDVGKVGVPDAVLLKPGKLTPEEFEIMKRHTIYGRDALAEAERKLGGESFLGTAKNIAYSHHERWDGKGYPLGLSGNEIPLEARIMSVADVYDALRSKRVYKDAMSHEAAMDIIFAGHGTQFDSQVLDALRQIEGECEHISTEWADDVPEVPVPVLAPVPVPV